MADINADTSSIQNALDLVNEIKCELSSMDARFVELQREVRLANRSLRRFQSELNDAAALQKDQERTITRLEIELMTLKMENNGLPQRIDGIQSRNQAPSTQLSIEEYNNSRLTAKVTVLAEALAKIEDQCAQLKIERADYRRRISFLEREREDLKEMLELSELTVEENIHQVMQCSDAEFCPTRESPATFEVQPSQPCLKARENTAGEAKDDPPSSIQFSFWDSWARILRSVVA